LFRSPVRDQIPPGHIDDTLSPDKAALFSNEPEISGSALQAIAHGDSLAEPISCTAFPALGRAAISPFD
jgi:hypothetical protein